MAIYHASIQTLSRSRGHSAVAAAAYRCGSRLVDERTGAPHDFTHKSGVLAARMVVPKEAPAWAHDVSKVWNAAEAAETRSNSRVGRDLVVALPHELPETERSALAHRIADALVERYSAAVLVALHAPDPGGDARNHHAHLLFSTRVLGPDGFGAKVRDLDDREQGPREVEFIRCAVADLTNAALAAAGASEQVDPRSLSRQAKEAERDGDLHRAAELTREPTEHVGRIATAAARRGEVVDAVVNNSERAAEHRTWLERFRAAVGMNDLRAPSGVRGAAKPRLRGTATLQHRVFGNILGGPARIARATGRDAALLNGQADMLAEGIRVQREMSQAYLDGLKRAAEQNAVLVEAFLAAGGPGIPSVLRSQCEVPGVADLLRRSIDERLALRALKDELPSKRRAYGTAMAATADARRELEELDAQQPSALKLLTRRQWAEKRRAQRAHVAEAERREQKARGAVAGAGPDAIATQAATLRTSIKAIERERLAVVRRASVRVATGASKVPPRPSDAAATPSAPRPGLRL